MARLKSQQCLGMNDIKTKAMILEGTKAPKMQSKAAFDRLVHEQEGKTHREATLEKVQCQLCGFMSQPETGTQTTSVEENM